MGLEWTVFPQYWVQHPREYHGNGDCLCLSSTLYSDGYSDPLIYYVFLCQVLVFLLPLIPYCVYFALSKALIFLR